jgi:hypothetical protein
VEIRLTPEARAFLQSRGATAVTVASLVFSSCCSGPLPPEVKVGPPADADGFDRFQAGDITVYYDSLLYPRPEVVICLKDFGRYQELQIDGWA